LLSRVKASTYKSRQSRESRKAKAIIALEKGVALRGYSLDIRNERGLTKDILELETTILRRF